MKKITKKNQIIISALAIMIAVAGYLSFTNKDIKILDENGNPISLKATDDVQETIQTDAEDINSVAENENEQMAIGAEGNEDDAEVSAPVEDSIGEAVLTNATSVTVTSDAIINAKLNREQTRSKSQEMLMQIVNNETMEDEAKQAAVEKLVAMTEVMEKESACEQQLLAKGFGECVVLISDNCVDVTVNRKELTDVEKAQIEDIITRKAACDMNEIVITVVGN